MSIIETELERLLEPIAERVVQRLLDEYPVEANQTDEYLSVKNAARRFDIPENTLRAWLKRGTLKGHRIQGCVRIRVADLIKQ